MVNMHKKILIVVGITFLFLGVGIQPAYGDIVIESNKPLSKGRTLYVGGTGPDNYTRIQDAVDDAVNGDTVFVYDDSSPYIEHVSIHDDINLIGENRDTTIIDGGGSKPVVFLATAKGVTLTEFTIRNGYTGIHVHYNSWSNNIKNNKIMNNLNGIILRTSPYNIITENIISKNNIGIELIGSDDNTICRNTISRNIFGVKLGFEIGEITADCSNNSIIKNNFLFNRVHASFIFLGIYSGLNEDLHLNNWWRNYWGRPRILPKPIFGLVTFVLPWINFDLRPALKPYNIANEYETKNNL